MGGISWAWVLIVILLVCPISMLLMRRGHRNMHDDRSTGGGTSHDSPESRGANAAESGPEAGAGRPPSEVRRLEALEREIEALEGERRVNDVG